MLEQPSVSCPSPWLVLTQLHWRNKMRTCRTAFRMWLCSEVAREGQDQCPQYLLVWGLYVTRRQHLHMPKARFPKLTCLMPSFGKNTTTRWSQVCRSYCTRKYPRKTCHHILLPIHRGCLQDFLRDKKRTYPQVRLADILRCWWLKPSGQAAHGQSTHPGARGQHCPAQAAAGAGPDKERGKPWEVEFCLW